MKSLSIKLIALAAISAPLITSAQISDDKVKIGVLGDMSGVYSDVSGKGAVEAARMAVEAYGGKVAGKPIATRPTSARPPQENGLTSSRST